MRTSAVSPPLGSLGAEGYRVCLVLYPADITYDDTVTCLPNLFKPSQPSIYSRAQFDRQNMHVCENCLQFATELRSLAARSRYARTGVAELTPDRVVVGRTKDHIRDQLSTNLSAYPRQCTCIR